MFRTSSEVLAMFREVHGDKYKYPGLEKDVDDNELHWCEECAPEPKDFRDSIVRLTAKMRAEVLDFLANHFDDIESSEAGDLNTSLLVFSEEGLVGVEFAGKRVWYGAVQSHTPKDILCSDLASGFRSVRIHIEDWETRKEIVKSALLRAKMVRLVK